MCHYVVWERVCFCEGDLGKAQRVCFCEGDLGKAQSWQRVCFCEGDLGKAQRVDLCFSRRWYGKGHRPPQQGPQPLNKITHQIVDLVESICGKGYVFVKVVWERVCFSPPLVRERVSFLVRLPEGFRTPGLASPYLFK
jgi:hypothetical protein